MKRLFVILAAICMLALDASAQWYLFPIEEEKKSEEKKTDEKKEAPVHVNTVPDFVIEDTVSPATSSEFVLDIPQTINVAMLLPLNLGKKPSSNFLEMYGGALIAARELGKNGTKINLSLYDTVDEDSQITEEVLAGSDVIIGPVAPDDILRMIIRGEGSAFVSPLEPKAASLADSAAVIQAPAPWSAQIDDLVNWVKEEMKAGDRLVVVKDSTAAGMGEQARYLMERIAASGLRYSTVSSASQAPANQSASDSRYIVVSDRDAFVSAAVRQIGISAIRSKSNVYMYMTSKAHSAKGIETEYLYNANTRYTASYAVDYNDDRVKDFILAYRALFKDEPASFAYCGYDTLHYFVTMCSKYGRQWYKKLPEYSERGLQEDFRFIYDGRTGSVNNAVRRVVLSPDLLTYVQ